MIGWTGFRAGQNFPAVVAIPKKKTTYVDFHTGEI